ncbi:MAG: hypothetical protein K0S56_1052 [Microvirga sp.]|nr:hypothetical protein [Microvirga sp.]
MRRDTAAVEQSECCQDEAAGADRAEALRLPCEVREGCPQGGIRHRPQERLALGPCNQHRLGFHRSKVGDWPRLQRDAGAASDVTALGRCEHDLVERRPPALAQGAIGAVEEYPRR